MSADAYREQELLDALLRSAGVDAAIAAAERVRLASPGDAHALHRWARLESLRDPERAEQAYREALASRPSADLIRRYAEYLTQTGQPGRAADLLEGLLQRSACDASVLNFFVLCGLLTPDLDAVAWRRRLSPLVRRQYGVPDAGFRRLPGKPRYQLGLMTSALYSHPLAFFIEPLLRAIDRRRFFVVIFSSSPKRDEYHEKLRALADVFYDVERVPDAALVELVRDERLDLVLDLDSHTRGNRLAALARRLAPIQVSLYGLNTTSGLEAMDYRLTDVGVDPEGVEAEYSERLLRTDGPHIGWWAMSELPAPMERRMDPAAPRFGSFNTWEKFHPQLLAAWARLLQRFPGSTLRIVGLDDAVARVRVQQHFAGHGIEGQRLLLDGRLGRQELWEAIRSVDLALDTWPYGGGVTTALTLALGVPLVTVTGTHAASRVGAAFLRDLDLADHVAASPAALPEVVASILAPASDAEARHRGLRDRFERRYMDAAAQAARVAAALERALRAGRG
jgi:predicted O-linked N-acetylglucosamine transferase (SPINDLY family)